MFFLTAFSGSIPLFINRFQMIHDKREKKSPHARIGGL